MSKGSALALSPREVSMRSGTTHVLVTSARGNQQKALQALCSCPAPSMEQGQFLS